LLSARATNNVWRRGQFIRVGSPVRTSGNC